MAKMNRDGQNFFDFYLTWMKGMKGIFFIPFIHVK